MSSFPYSKIKLIFAISVVTLLFTACNATMNQNAFIGSAVQTAPLANGKILNVGYKLPDPAAQCQLVTESTRNWAVAETMGQLKFGQGRQVLLEEAVAEVDARPQDGINYVALIIPNQFSVGNINVTALRDAKTSYYRCVNPPQPS